MVRYGAGHEHHKPWVGAELARSHQAACREFGGDLITARGYCTGEQNNRIHARQLQINRFAGVVGRGFELQARRPAAGIGGGPDTRVGHGAGPVGVVRAV